MPNEERVGGIFLISAPFFGEGGWQVEGFTMLTELGLYARAGETQPPGQRTI